MKQISILFGLILFIAGCAQTDYDCKLENDILNCFYQHHEDNGIKIKNTIDRLEDIYVQHDILKGKSGEDYIATIKSIQDNNDLNLNDTSLFGDLNSLGYIPSSLFCMDSSLMLDTTSFYNSKYKYVIGIFDTIAVKGDVSPSLIAGEILEVFTARDFENDFYKTICLIMFTSLVKTNQYYAHEKGIPDKLRVLPKEKRNPVDPKNIFVILINNENKILAEGELVDVSNIKPMVKRFLLETSDKIEIDLPLIGKQMTSKGMISLQNDRGTSYKVYISVQNELISAYQEIRNEYSQKFFDATFDNLDDDKKQIIKDLVPQRISEAEPKI